MDRNFRRFTAGPDPFGRSWEVEFVWLQTAISIRHADAVDVKFFLTSGAEKREMVIALPHADLLALAKRHGRDLTDPWCMKLAALHVEHVIATFEDFEKTLVVPLPQQLELHARALDTAPVAAR